MDGKARPGIERLDPSKQIEAKLIERARNGDKQAVAELYEQHVDSVFRYVYTRTSDRALAEDLTAQVFLKALEDLPKYRTTGTPFSAWLFRIACARVADHWRSFHRHKEVPLDLAATDPTHLADPGHSLDAEQKWNAAFDMLAQLTEDQQSVLILRFIGEMDLERISEALGKSVGAVKAIQHRALATLARIIRTQDQSHQNGAAA